MLSQSHSNAWSIPRQIASNISDHICESWPTIKPDHHYDKEITQSIQTILICQNPTTQPSPLQACTNTPWFALPHSVLPSRSSSCTREREHSKSLMKTPWHRSLPSTPLPPTPSRPTPLIEPGHIYRLLWPSVRLIYAFDSLCLFERKLNRRQRLAAQTPLLRRTAAGDADSTRTISGQETVASSSSSTLAPLRADHVLLRTS